MNFLKLKENVCRICLQNEVNINWYDRMCELSGISYKDCYYKYTSLAKIDPDPYPASLCNKCAEELRNVHKLIEKALESAHILKELDSKYCNYMNMCHNSPSEVNSEIVADNMDKEFVEEKPFSALCKIETNAKFENTSNESKTTKIDESAVVEPTYFIDIHNLEEHLDKLCDSKTPSSPPKKFCTRKNGNNQKNKTADNLSSTTKRTRSRKKSVVTTKDLLDHNNIVVPENKDTKTKKIVSKDISLEICKTKTAASTSKHRKKIYNFMCSYCSLKLEGTKSLEIHEATHNENRERTEICPKCGLKLFTDLALRLHMKTHDSNRQKNHKCEFCEKAFFNKGALNVHRRVHLGLMIKCRICEKDFFRQVDLDKHLLKHSASPLDKNVGKKKLTAQCQYCNKNIPTAKLKEHIAVHLDQPQMKCKICDKNFYSRTKCTKHLRQFHLKKLSEYEEFIHYYVDRNRRLSSLMIKQQLVVQHFK